MREERGEDEICSFLKRSSPNQESTSFKDCRVFFLPTYKISTVSNNLLLDFFSPSPSFFLLSFRLPYLTRHLFGHPFVVSTTHALSPPFFSFIGSISFTSAALISSRKAKEGK